MHHRSLLLFSCGREQSHSKWQDQVRRVSCALLPVQIIQLILFLCVSLCVLSCQLLANHMLHRESKIPSVPARGMAAPSACASSRDDQFCAKCRISAAAMPSSELKQQATRLRRSFGHRINSTLGSWMLLLTISIGEYAT